MKRITSDDPWLDRRFKWSSLMLKSTRLRLLAKGRVPLSGEINIFIRKDIRDKQKSRDPRYEIPRIRKALHGLGVYGPIDRKKESDALILEAQAIMDFRRKVVVGF